MGILKFTPNNLALIEAASADTFTVPVDNDPVKLMSAIIMWLITLIELDPRIFKLIKSDVALFLAAYKKIVGPEVIDKILKFTATYRNGGTEITMLGSSRMKGGVKPEQLEAAKIKAEAVGHTPEDIAFYNRTREQFERERQVVVAQGQLQQFNNQQQDQLMLQPVAQSALQAQAPDALAVKSELTNAYDVFAESFRELQLYRDRLGEREAAIEEQLEKLQPELNIDQAKLVELHASGDDAARVEAARKNIDMIQKEISAIDQKIATTSLTESRPLAVAAALSIGGTVAAVAGSTAILTVTGLGLAASALTGATLTGLVAGGAIAVAEGVAQRVEQDPVAAMNFMKNVGVGILNVFRRVGENHEDQWDNIVKGIEENRERELAQGVASGLKTPSGQPRIAERLTSIGIIPRVSTSTDTSLGPNLYSAVPSIPYPQSVRFGFPDGQEFCYNLIGEGLTMIEEPEDPSQPWSISLKKLIADRVIRYVALASITGAAVGTYYIADRFYKERKSALESQKAEYQANINRAITEVETVLNAARTQRQQLINRVENALREVRREQEALVGRIGALHTEFTQAEEKRLTVFKQLAREYTQAVAAAHASAQNYRMNQQMNQVQLMMLATMAQPGLLQDQARQMLQNTLPQPQLLGNVASGQLPPSSQVEEKLDEGGGSTRHRTSLPTRKVGRSSSSSKRSYTHRRRALQTGKVGYRPTKTGRKV
jgi:hypothetical protein